MYRVCVKYRRLQTNVLVGLECSCQILCISLYYFCMYMDILFFVNKYECLILVSYYSHIWVFLEHFLLIWTYMPIETISKSKRKGEKKETKKPIKTCIERVWNKEGYTQMVWLV